MGIADLAGLQDSVIKIPWDVLVGICLANQKFGMRYCTHKKEINTIWGYNECLLNQSFFLLIGLDNYFWTAGFLDFCFMIILKGRRKINGISFLLILPAAGLERFQVLKSCRATLKTSHLNHFLPIGILGGGRGSSSEWGLVASKQWRLQRRF